MDVMMKMREGVAGTFHTDINCTLCRDGRVLSAVQSSLHWIAQNGDLRTQVQTPQLVTCSI